ncbi:MAG: glycosyltransferase N-terminal domain-containing protein, partial [Bacteroidota bacterium]
MNFLYLLYRLGIYAYGGLIRLASPFVPKASKWISGRKGWRIKVQETHRWEEPVVWFHCASLGEFEQGRPVLEKIRARFPSHKIVLTFFSPSGYE